jgi:hypothetical protein
MLSTFAMNFVYYFYVSYPCGCHVRRSKNHKYWWYHFKTSTRNHNRRCSFWDEDIFCQQVTSSCCTDKTALKHNNIAFLTLDSFGVQFSGVLKLDEGCISAESPNVDILFDKKTIFQFKVCSRWSGVWWKYIARMKLDLLPFLGFITEENSE